MPEIKKDIRAATFVVAASDSLHKNMADYVCPGVNDEVTIHTVRDQAATLGGEIYFLEGHYMLGAPIEWNVAGLHVNTVGCPFPWFATDKGAIFEADAGFGGAYLMRVSAHDQILDNLYLKANLRVNVGLQVEDCRLCFFPNVVIDEPLQKGVLIKGTSALCAGHRFGLLQILMNNTTETDARGLVFDGASAPNAASVLTFNVVQITLLGVATSYGVDFAKYADGIQINYLQISYATSPLTAGVIFNSDTPGSDMGVYINKILAFLYEAGHYPQVIANTARARYPNIIGIASYDWGSYRGHRDDLRVLSWGVKPITWVCLFESLDGLWDNPGGTGSVTLQLNSATVATGGTTGGIGRLRKSLALFPGATWNRRRGLRTQIDLSSITNQTAYIVSGIVGNHLAGFKVVNNALYGVTDDGVEETLDLGVTLVAATPYELECHFVPGLEARFYVDGVDKGAITTHLPTGPTYHYLMDLYIINTADENKEMRASYWDFEQEG